ncbi:MAG TPA: hypothetical protein VMU84_17350 [Thermoanaerobaculia bacterium]|nr:hypothetical protein [Thermoanaerobaculia bacterium]
MQRTMFLIAFVATALSAAQPHYETLTADAAKKDIMVFSRRNYAMFGFNDSAITIRLPRNDNSIYATVEYAKPVVVDKRGKPVAFEIEHGIYNFDNFTNEIRLQKASGKGPLEFSRVSGTITLKVPLAIKTTRVKKSKPIANIRFEGSSITLENMELPEPATFSKIQPLRAYDAKGSELERKGSSGLTITFDGNVAEVQIDHVETCATFTITYDLPPVPPLPDSQQGMAQTFIKETPGGVVKVRVEP